MIKIIYAESANGIIGSNGKLPWNIHEDLKRFQKLTKGHFVVMGRLTWLSLPDIFRPLPGRKNIVLTSDTTFEPGNVHVSVMRSFDEVLELDKRKLKDLQNNPKDIWIIGGRMVYEAAAPFADEIYLTEVMRDYKGDVTSPLIKWSDFEQTNVGLDVEQTSERSGIKFRFLNYKRKC